MKKPALRKLSETLFSLRFRSTALFFPLLCFSLYAAGEPRRVNLLTGKYSQEFLSSALLPQAAWRLFPPAKDRQAWQKATQAGDNAQRCRALLSEAEKLRSFSWPPLPATLYMEFARTGNRSHYQEQYFFRRKALATLVLAECIEYRGRFLDHIANGLWALCEESTWCIPAHAARYSGDVLPRPDVQSLDLFACETGMTVALALSLLEPELRRLARALVERTCAELRRRILAPYEAGDTFGCSWWVRGYNNWSPWCASSVLGVLFLCEKDREKLLRSTWRLMQVVDRFVNGYGEDGGCNEGPSYWNQAAGALCIFLEFLRSRSSGRISIWNDPKIKAMGLYIVRAHLAGPYFANYADADAKPHLHPAKLYLYGERTGSESLKALAALCRRNAERKSEQGRLFVLSGVSGALLGPLMELFWIPPELPAVPLVHEPYCFLPHLQLFVARQEGTSERGLVLAAKGGHNAESHNHNDVGHLIVVLERKPAIIDVGRETYTRDTFSSRRYTLWFTRGRSHNAPVINGIEQQPGQKYRATKVEFEKTDDTLCLSLDLTKAYPQEARLLSLTRSVVFKRQRPGSVMLSDSFRCGETSPVYRVTFYSPSPVVIRKPGLLEIQLGRRPLLLSYAPLSLRARTETVKVSDPLLRKNWGPFLRRITVEGTFQGRGGSTTFTFQPGPAVRQQ